MAEVMVKISAAQLSKLVAEHKAAQEFLNVYFNPTVTEEEKDDKAVALDAACHAVTATVRQG